MVEPVLAAAPVTQAPSANVTGLEGEGDLVTMIQALQAAAAGGDASAIHALAAVTAALQEFALKKISQPQLADVVTAAAVTPEASGATAAATVTGGNPVAVAASVATPEAAATVGAAIPSVPVAEAKSDVAALLEKLNIKQTAPGSKALAI